MPSFVKIRFFNSLIVVPVVLVVRETVLPVVLLINTRHGRRFDELIRSWGEAADHSPVALRRSVGVRGMQVAMGSPMFVGDHSLFV